MANAEDTAGSPAGHVNVSIRMTPAFRDWIDRLAARSRVTRSIAVEHGLLLLAQANDFEIPPPKR